MAKSPATFLPVAPPSLVHSLQILLQDPSNSIFLVSSLSPEVVGVLLANLLPSSSASSPPSHPPSNNNPPMNSNSGGAQNFVTIFSENGFLMQRMPPNSLNLTSPSPITDKFDLSWKAIVKSEISEFVEQTPGSYLVEKRHSLLWCHEKVKEKIFYVN